MAFKISGTEMRTAGELFPFVYHAVDWVTEEIMNPKQLKLDKDRKAVNDGYGQPVMEDAPMECLESLARRVVGALCYSGLLIAAVAEAIARIALSLAALPFTLPLLACEEFEKSWTVYFLLHLISAVTVVIDAPVRMVSALVQKCLLDQVDKSGNRLRFSQLHVINC
ncbi:MAG: hypothetical protein HYX48_05740 [Chlamydiales bacterium]|nr:hypothetical protein [Chlamydiales bacterium]